MMAYKLGRRAPLWTPGHMARAHLMTGALNALGPRPEAPADYVSAVTDLVGNRWGMMLNDTWGDCTAADTGHRDMILKANTGTWTGVPTDADIIALYERTGFDPSQTIAPGENPTDQGADENAVEEDLISVGFLGNKASATGMIVTGTTDEAALDRIGWGIHMFGGVRLGVNLPSSAENQFSADLPWEIAGDLRIVGGHDVLAVSYDDNHFFVVTWGGQPRRQDGLTPVTFEWMMRFCEEAHCSIWPMFVMNSGTTPAGFDMAQLSANLRRLTA